MQYNRATPAVPFQYAVPAIDHFPFRVWTKLVDKCYYKLKRASFGYGDPAGFHPLREAIAAYLKSFRAVNCTPEQVIITSGAQDAFDLIARVLLNPKTVVWVENPCYLSAKQIFASAGAN